MTLAQQVGRLHREQEASQAAREFGALCKFILSHGGKFSDAIQAAQEGGLANVRGLLSTRTVEILKQTTGREISRADLMKTLVSPQSLSGSPFQDLSIITSGWIGSLGSFGAFDRMLADGALREIPLQPGSIGSVNVAATGYVVAEGQLKPISKLSLSGFSQIPLKVHCAVIVSQELARSPLLASGQLIQNELRNAVAVATDSAFITSIIASGVIPASSYGTSALSVRMDIEWLLRQVALKQTSRPYLLTTPAIAGTLSQMNNNGVAAFPELGPQGGFISQIPVLVSDAVPAGYLMLVDAAQIAGASGELILQQLDEGIVQADTTPDSPPTGTTNLQSLWQLNLTGLRIERYLIAQKLTSNAVAVINNANSYVSANSP